MCVPLSFYRPRLARGDLAPVAAVLGELGHRHRPGLLRRRRRLGHLAHRLQLGRRRRESAAHPLEEPRERHLLRGHGHLRRDSRDHPAQQGRAAQGSRLDALAELKAKMEKGE